MKIESLIYDFRGKLHSKISRFNAKGGCLKSLCAVRLSEVEVHFQKIWEHFNPFSNGGRSM